MRLLLAGAVLLSVACAAAPPEPAVRVTISDGRPAMGTILEITLSGAEGSLSHADLDPLFAEVQRLEAIFSRYEPASALMLLNAAAGRGPRRVPGELTRILTDCMTLSDRTRGSFDVTVGPLVDLWTDAGRVGRLPDPGELRRARDTVGAGKLRIGRDGRVELTARGMALDLDGVAKGWALDRVAERLRTAGVTSALLDFGGSSVLALGHPPDGPGWRTLLRDAGSGFAGTLTLRDRALSVSASLGKESVIEGRRYGHVLDPRSGQPMTRGFLAAIVAPGAGEAEGWSKALLVLGSEGLDLLEQQPGVEGLLVDDAGNRDATSGFIQASGFVELRGTLRPKQEDTRSSRRR